MNPVLLAIQGTGPGQVGNRGYAVGVLPGQRNFAGLRDLPFEHHYQAQAFGGRLFVDVLCRVFIQDAQQSSPQGYLGWRDVLFLLSEPAPFPSFQIPWRQGLAAGWLTAVIVLVPIRLAGYSFVHNAQRHRYRWFLLVLLGYARGSI